MDIDHLSARHEGVDRRIVDEHDIDIAGAQACRLHQRFGHVLQQCLGLGIAQDALRHGRLGCEREGQQAGERPRREADEEAGSSHHGDATLALRGLNVS